MADDEQPTANATEAARAARRLSQAHTERILAGVLARVASAPDRVEDALADRAEPLLAFTPARRVLAANAAAERFFGHPGGLPGHTIDVLLPPRLRRPDAPPIVAPEALTTVEQPGLRGGAEVPLAWTFGAAPGGEILVLAVRDRGEMERAVEALHASEERLRALVDGVREQQLAEERAARRAAEEGLARLRRLHAAAVALSRATALEDVAAAVLDLCASSEVAAAASALFVVDVPARALRLVAERGHPTGWSVEYASLPLEGGMPVGDAVARGEALFFESAHDLTARYPSFAAAIARSGFEGSVVLPLVARGAVLGVLTVRYLSSRAFGEADRALLLTTSELSAQAIERARLFEAERRARGEAEAASRAKDAFLAMLGHELRNPLAPIATAVHLMKSRGDATFVREREVIERQVRHLSRLVDDLLDVSRITRGDLALSKEPVAVADAIARALETVGPLLEARRHGIAVDVPASLRVLGDPGRLAQVFSNLLVNAAKYTPPGGHVAVRAAVEAGEVVVRVQDDGEGIGPELLPHVFDLFVQGRRTFDRAQGGLGIGLALVQSLVAQHGGRVRAHSAGPGRGSEFSVHLPAFDAAPSVPEVAPARPRASSRKRVLVVDDNVDSAEMVQAALTAFGYEVAVAFDGAAALERLREFAADAAVLDLGLPVLDGFELARRIRAQLPGRSLRLVALTGYGQEHDRRRSREAGFDAHLVKPIDFEAVLDALERVE